MTETIKEKLDKILFNQEMIENLTKNNDESIIGLMNNFIKSGQYLLELFDKETINSWSIRKIHEDYQSLSNYKYLQKFKDSEFFVNDKKYENKPLSIIEIDFIDTLEVTKEWKVVGVVAGQYVIELTFNSKRVKLVQEKIKFNKFRFVYYTWNGSMTCRILTEN